MNIGTQDAHLIAKILMDVLDDDLLPEWLYSGRERVRADALLEDLTSFLNVMVGMDWPHEDVK